MLREDFYQRQKKSFRIWKVREWARGLLLGLASSLIFAGLIYAIYSGSSRQLVGFLTQQSFPFESILMEGAPGYSQPERARLDLTRNQEAAVSMFLLTGVNIADPRTFFLGYFSPPPQGPVWLGWAYNPKDPEFEGPILEPIESDTPKPGGTEAVIPPVPTPAPSPGTKEILVGIYNTHNSECYAGDGGPERRTGENGDVVTVGETLKKDLIQDGIGSVHSLQIHDAVDFMKAYSKSVKTATQMLADYPNMKILLDIHRDGFPSGVPKRTVVVKGQQVTQVLVIIGKMNPHWQINEALAKQLMALAEKKYPGLFSAKISYADDARYNQHLSNGGLLLEFGSQNNTLAEANGAADAVAEILADYLKAKP